MIGFPLELFTISAKNERHLLLLFTSLLSLDPTVDILGEVTFFYFYHHNLIISVVYQES